MIQYNIVMVWRGRSHRDFGAAATAWRHRAFTLVALLAVFLQAFVVQTHVHAMGAPASITAQQSGAAHDDTSHVTAGAEHQLICAICQALASSGTATLPSAVKLLVAVQANTAALVALAIAPDVQSHSWRSRAPPLSL